MGYYVGFASSGVWAMAGQWFLVDRTTCLWVRMCPFWVYSDSGNYLLKIFILTKGHDR